MTTAGRGHCAAAVPRRRVVVHGQGPPRVPPPLSPIPRHQTIGGPRPCQAGGSTSEPPAITESAGGLTGSAAGPAPAPSRRPPPSILQPRTTRPPRPGTSPSVNPKPLSENRGRVSTAISSNERYGLPRARAAAGSRSAEYPPPRARLAVISRLRLVTPSGANTLRPPSSSPWSYGGALEPWPTAASAGCRWPRVGDRTLSCRVPSLPEPGDGKTRSAHLEGGSRVRRRAW